MKSIQIRVYVSGQQAPFFLGQHTTSELPTISDWIMVDYGAYRLMAQVWRVLHTLYPLGFEGQMDAPFVEVVLGGEDAQQFLLFWTSLTKMREELRLRNVEGLKTRDMEE